MKDSVFARAHACLMACAVEEKLQATHALWADWCAGRLCLEGAQPAPVTLPGRPERPQRVPPQAVPRRRLGSPAGHAALIHALAHIEFNAVNLALDAAVRFRDMPQEYYAGWLQVADDEARHFALLREHLRALGFDYGDFPAHDGLWEMAQKTAHDPLVRMALVPRVLEARGLDATPAIISKLSGLGDARGVEILQIILQDEVGHVALGDRWFRWLCAGRGLEAERVFVQLMQAFDAPRLVPPINMAARQAAGFGVGELAALAAGGEKS